MFLPIVLTILLAVHGSYAQTCRTVATGQFYSTLSFSVKSASVITTRVRMDPNTASYVFPPTELQGQMCSYSWNKLWGATRCGYFVSNHKDSDRFMWRRVPTCLIYSASGTVIGQNTNCSEANLIEICAAAYDNGVRPYENEGTLLKQFSTKLQVNVWYRLTLRFSSSQTIYELADSANVLIESQTINHRTCSNFNQGSMQNLYFGGQCAAPQPVTVCYAS